LVDAPPVACSLSGSDQQDRVRDLAEFGRSNLIGRTTDDGTQRLRFRRTPENDEKLRSIIAGRAEVLPFLAFDLSRMEGEVVLGSTPQMPLALSRMNSPQLSMVGRLSQIRATTVFSSRCAFRAACKASSINFASFSGWRGSSSGPS
jgi:hypothetical protein